MSAATPVQNPFPGLRPFKTEESTLFFGRDDQIGEALDRMLRQKLLVVVGVSGCGKSSLVIAGMIPTLEMGLAGDPEQHWRVASMRPGDGPLRELARCLGFGEALAERTYGLQEAVETHLQAGHNLLLLVDQFEEIFPFRDRKLRAGAGSEADLFVSYLLRAAQDKAGRIYVLLTMRSDYLGECAKFHGLPEALNDGQYVVPRMTRQQLQEAIEGPLEAAAVKMHPALVQELLNQCDEEPDNLPLLQHLLRRMFEQWKAEGGQGPITSAMGKSVGGLAGALNQDAEKVCAGLSSEELRVAEVLFRRITESRRQADRAEDDRPVRRPQTVAVLANLARVDETVIRIVVGQFEQRGLLVVRQTDQGDKVDLPHECLCLRWNRLKDWILAEAEDAKKLRFLWDATERKAPLAGLALEEALEWQRAGKLDAAWCSRYLSPEQIVAVTAWVTESHRLLTEAAARERLSLEAEGRSRRWTKAVLLLSLLTAAFGGLGIWALRQSAKANSEAITASNEASKAARAKAEADTLRAQAQADATMATQKEQDAEKARDDAKTNLRLADDNLNLAQENEKKYQKAVEKFRSFQLASRSDSVFHDEPAGLEKAVLLAIESLRWRPSAQGDKALRQAVSLLPARRVSWRNAASQEAFAQVTRTDAFPKNGMLISQDKLRVDLNQSLLRLSDATTKLPAGEIRLPNKVGMIAFSPDGKWLATGSDDRTARLFDLTSRTEVVRLTIQGPVSNVAFTPDSKQWRALSNEKVAVLEVPAAARSISPPSRVEANSVAFSIDGKRLATGSKDDLVRLIDPASGNELFSIGMKNEINAVAFSADNYLTAITIDNVLKTINVLTRISPKEKVENFDQHAVFALAFSADKKWMAAGCDDGKVRVFDLTSKRPPTLIDHGAAVYAVAFSPDGKFLATGGMDSTAVLWDFRAERRIRQFNYPGRVYVAAFSADSHLLATGGGNSITVTEVPSGQELHHIDMEDGSVVAAAHFSVNGPWLETVHQISEFDKGLIYTRHLLDTQTFIREACERLSDNRKSLTEDEWKQDAPDIPPRQICQPDKDPAKTKAPPNRSPTTPAARS